MVRLNKNHFRKVSASVMVFFFFTSQAFSCCLVDHRMGDYLKASLAEILPESSGQSVHACCPSKQEPKAPHKGHGDSESGCCIQNASSKVPQIASEGMAVPSLAAIVVERWRPVEEGRPFSTIAQPPGHSISAPPLYLTHLRILI